MRLSSVVSLLILIAPSLLTAESLTDNNVHNLSQWSLLLPRSRRSSSVCLLPSQRHPINYVRQCGTDSTDSTTSMANTLNRKHAIHCRASFVHAQNLFPTTLRRFHTFTHVNLPIQASAISKYCQRTSLNSEPTELAESDTRNSQNDQLTKKNGLAMAEINDSNRAIVREGKMLLMNKTNANDENNGNPNNTTKIVQVLRKKAQDLRREATLAEQHLQKDRKTKRESERREVDAWINCLLEIDDLQHFKVTNPEEEAPDASHDSNSNSEPRKDTPTERSAMPGIPSDETLATRLQQYKLTTPTKLTRIVERLHERETNLLVGAKGLLSQPDLEIDQSKGESNSTRISRGVVLGDYENNSVERKQEESRCISGLLDSLLNAVQLLEDKTRKAPGSKEVSPLTPTGSGSSNKNYSMMKSPGSMQSARMAPTLRSKVVELRQIREETVKRRLDGEALADNSVKSTGTSGKGENDENGEGMYVGLDPKQKMDKIIRSSLQGPFMESNNSENNNQNGKIYENKNNKIKQAEKMMKRLIETPTWLPPSLVPYAATSPVEVDSLNWKKIKSDLLVDSGFICGSWDCTDVAAVYRGRLSRSAAASIASLSNAENDGSRGNPNGPNGSQREDGMKIVFQTILTRLEKHPELNSKVQLFVVDDNEWRPAYRSSYATAPMGDDENSSTPPVILALAKEVLPEQEVKRGVAARFLATISTVSTLVTTLAYSLTCYALNPTFFQSVMNLNDLTSLPLCLPLFFGVLALTAVHELGHFIAAKSHGVNLGAPVPLPSLQIGTFGCVTPLRSFPPSRLALFDVAYSGPALSLLTSILLILCGLNLTIQTDSFVNFPFVPAAIFRSSFFIGAITSVIAPKMMLLPLSQPVPISPLFLIGLFGLVMSACNLLPIGRLDGGRMAMAIWGRRVASNVSLLCLLLLAVYSFNGLSGVIIFWGAAIVLLRQRIADVPCVDEVSEVGEGRGLGYFALFLLSIVVLAPFPGDIMPI